MSTPMSRRFLALMFGAILISMLAVTTWAALDRSILDVGPELWGDRWFHATLADAYAGFLTFYVWLAYCERSWIARVVWFVAIMLLGNIAMSGYVLWRVARLSGPFRMEDFLLGRDRGSIA